MSTDMYFGTAVSKVPFQIYQRWKEIPREPGRKE